MNSTITTINCGQELRSCAFDIQIGYGNAIDLTESISLVNLIKEFLEGEFGLHPDARVSGTIEQRCACLHVISDDHLTAEVFVDQLLEWSRVHGRYNIKINDLGATDYELLSDWTKVDIDSIVQSLRGSQEEVWRSFKQAVRKKLAQLIELNGSRSELRSEFESILENRNRRKEAKLAEFLRTMVTEINRANSEGLSEGELEVCDILEVSDFPGAASPAGRDCLKKLAKLVYQQFLLFDPFNHEDDGVKVVFKLADIIEVNWCAWMDVDPEDFLGVYCADELLASLSPWRSMVKDPQEVHNSTKSNLVEEWAWPPAEDKD